jgi:hypothetical protein
MAVSEHESMPFGLFDTDRYVVVRPQARKLKPSEFGRAGQRRIKIGQRVLTATPVLDTYWRFACARQDVFMRRMANEAPPWTADPIISAHRFTNAYRASDRVSQYLIRNVIYEGDQSVEEVFFRTVLFKLFNRIETWERLIESVGAIRWKSHRLSKIETTLDAMMASGERVYSAAYIMPAPSFGEIRKHANHLRLLEHMMRNGAPRKVATAAALSEVFSTLRSYPSLGDFLAFQFAIDLNYGPQVNFSEMDFVVAGPGARDGIKKCFADVGGLDEAEVIRIVAEMATSEFDRLGLNFRDLWGRPLQLIDCQNLFCEVSKYARVAHPEAVGCSGRSKIKQRFVATSRATPQWYPPKWNVHPPVSAATNNDAKVGRKHQQRSLFISP